MKIFISLLSLLLCGNNYGHETQNNNRIIVSLNFSELTQPNMSSNKKREESTKTKYTMVTYVDKNDCPLCFVCHLQEWEIFMKYCNVENIPLNFVFIFHPECSNEPLFTDKLHSTSISKISYIDTHGTFREKNPWLNHSDLGKIFIIAEKKAPIFVDAPPYGHKFLSWLHDL
ncbi:MAG: hypothetical protein Q4F52_08745 [Bacteroidaceae bacterium]|nr:hypothetical protein [Bacteroidaceae bacterium]